MEKEDFVPNLNIDVQISMFKFKVDVKYCTIRSIFWRN